jgi:hypothetical protein
MVADRSYYGHSAELCPNEFGSADADQRKYRNEGPFSTRLIYLKRSKAVGDDAHLRDAPAIIDLMLVRVAQSGDDARESDSFISELKKRKYEVVKPLRNVDKASTGVFTENGVEITYDPETVCGWLGNEPIAQPTKLLLKRDSVASVFKSIFGGRDNPPAVFAIQDIVIALPNQKLFDKDKGYWFKSYSSIVPPVVSDEAIQDYLHPEPPPPLIPHFAVDKPVFPPEVVAAAERSSMLPHIGLLRHYSVMSCPNQQAIVTAELVFNAEKKKDLSVAELFRAGNAFEAVKTENCFPQITRDMVFSKYTPWKIPVPKVVTPKESPPPTKERHYNIHV